MPSQRQIDANRQNAQHSTGPTTEGGKQRSSLNSTKHGFTGQSLILSPEETGLYHAFVQQYFEDFAPYDAVTKQLTQQLADAHWSLQQIFVQQSNLLALLNAATNQLNQTGDAVTTATTLATLSKTLQTYTTYENRRRRAADAIEAKLTALLDEHAERLKREIPQAAKLAKLHKSNGQPFNPADFGFVCSAEDIEQYLKGEALAQSVQNTTPQPKMMTTAEIHKYVEELEALENQSKS